MATEGGAPVTQGWADQIGADGFAPSTPEAVEIAEKLVGKGQAVARVARGSRHRITCATR